MRSNSDIVFSLSIVSHGHRKFILSLLTDLTRLARSDIEVILTWNLQEEMSELDESAYPFPLISIHNRNPKGFSENHNTAFQRSRGTNFVLMNPDIRLPEDPFGAMLDTLSENPETICAPVILSTDGRIEDSARFFPSPLLLAKKAMAKILKYEIAVADIPKKGSLLNPDWIAGMFIVVPRRIYDRLGGLSERYYLYYEDVDFCARARIQGIDVMVTPATYAIHDARRESHKNLRFMLWHLKSAFLFFTSATYLKLSLQRTQS